MRLLTSGAGVVHPRAVSTVEALITDEVAGGWYDPPADPATLAYAIVRLAEAFLYNDAGIRGDHERLREVQAALLGVPMVGPGRRRGPAPEGPALTGACNRVRYPPALAVGSPGAALCPPAARRPQSFFSHRPSARTPPWIPLGQTRIAAISTSP